MKTLLPIIACIAWLALSPLAFATKAPPPPTIVCDHGKTVSLDPGRVGGYLEDHPGTTLGACSTPPAAPAAPAALPNAPARVELCSPAPRLRADGTTGIYQDWLYADWKDPKSVASAWPLAVYVVGKGLTCDNHGPAVAGAPPFEGLYTVYSA